MDRSYNIADIADTYYKMKVRMLFGISYFKGRTITDTSVLAAYKSLLSNVEASYHNLTKVKAELNLPLYDFNEYHGDGFFIHHGKLYGDIAKAREYANTTIRANSDNTENKIESNRILELGLCLRYFCEKLKDIKYIELPKEVKELYCTINDVVSVKDEGSLTVINPDEATVPNSSIFNVFSIFKE